MVLAFTAKVPISVPLSLLPVAFQSVTLYTLMYHSIRPCAPAPAPGSPGVKLPTYKEYWEAVSNDKRPVVSEADSIEEVSNVNIVGNVWDLTLTENEKGEIRLAGGSYLCSINTCHGTQPDRILYVDKETANTHISMVVYDHDK